MLKLTLKHLKKFPDLTKNEKRKARSQRLVNLHSFILHFFIANQTSVFFTIFIIRESTKKDGVKTRRGLFDEN